MTWVSLKETGHKDAVPNSSCLHSLCYKSYWRTTYAINSLAGHRWMEKKQNKNLLIFSLRFFNTVFKCLYAFTYTQKNQTQDNLFSYIKTIKRANSSKIKLKLWLQGIYFFSTRPSWEMTCDNNNRYMNSLSKHRALYSFVLTQPLPYYICRRIWTLAIKHFCTAFNQSFLKSIASIRSSAPSSFLQGQERGPV